MAKIHVFADEAGDFVFSRAKGASAYFILGTATMRDCSVGGELLELRREITLRQGLVLHEFHATNDKQRVRDMVYDVIQATDVRFDFTIMEKPKTQPHLQSDPGRFYKEAWFLHFKYVAPHVAQPSDELLVVASSFQIKRKKIALHWAVRDVVRQVSPTVRFQTAFWPAVSDPCLQVADYACWAVQRKYEMGDPRSYVLVQGQTQSEFQPFRSSSVTYY